jgi:hypothetical protein
MAEQPATPDDDVEPVSYSTPIGQHEYIEWKTTFQTIHDIQEILKGKTGVTAHKDGAYVVARPLIPRLRVWATDAKNLTTEQARTVTPLEAHVYLSFPVPPVDQYFPLALFHFKRVHTYISFVAGSAVPVRVEFGAPNTSYGFEGDGVDLQERNEELREAWMGAVQNTRTTQDLLERIKPGEPLDRAISRCGSSIIDRDEEDRYLHSWTAIELLAYEWYAQQPSARADAPTNTRIRKYLRQSGRSPGRNTVRAYEGLRNDVAHGHFDFDRFRDLIHSLDDVRALARELTVDTIQSRGLVPKGPARFSSRVVVRSWRGGNEPPVQPYYEVYPPKGVADFPSRRKPAKSKK